jgi:glycosyltransferase involved in cell wall biosynthesis
MRVLIVTKIFPSSVEPLSSPFNRKQFGALSKLCDVEVLATIPWFPGAAALKRWSPAGKLTQVPRAELIDGIRVLHPRVAFVPKVGHSVAGPLYAASLASVALGYRDRVDVVLGAWAYPDGFAAVALAELLGVPAVVKLHGSDMNVVARWPGPRRQLEWALPRAARVVAVSQPLADAAAELGVARSRIDLVPNGVDRDSFRPRDRAAARVELGIDIDPARPMVLYVGHVTEQKGTFDLVRAFAAGRERLRGADLVIVGDGAGLTECRALAEQLGVTASFVGPQAHERIPTWLGACDVLALPSWNEGMPNVVLEALASGRRVVATRVGGIPDVVQGQLGELVAPRDIAGLADALVRVLETPYEPAEIAAAFTRPDWAGSAALLYDSLLHALASRASEAA